MLYAYVTPINICRGKFCVRKAEDSQELFESSQHLCDIVANLLNEAHEEGYTTGKANAETRRKTTAEKLFPDGKR